MWKNIFSQLDVTKDCKKYNIPLTQCPSFLFMVISALIIASILIGYVVGIHYVGDPMVVALAVVILAGILVPLNFTIVKGVERLAEANILKTEFLNIMSHQLRTPLSASQWVVSLFLSGGAGQMSKEQEEYMRLLKENNDRMANLVSDLLVVSKIEHASVVLQREPVDIERIIRQVIQDIRSTMKSADSVEISFSADGHIPPVLASEIHVKMILSRLVQNAVQYRKGKGTVALSVKKEGAYVSIKVQDDGVGIPQKEQKHIFTKFYRSRNTLRYQTEGTGLSLFIVKSLVLQHGGTIGFESREGEGSAFWFTLPIKQSHI